MRFCNHSAVVIPTFLDAGVLRLFGSQRQGLTGFGAVETNSALVSFFLLTDDGRTDFTLIESLFYHPFPTF